MKPFVLWVSIFVTLALLGQSRARAEGNVELLLLEVSERDAEDTARLRELLDRPVTVERLPVSATSPVHYARSLGVKQVLILDRAQGRVSLVRSGEPEVFTRETFDVASRSNYAVSFVAAELLSTAAELEPAPARRFGLTSVWLSGAADLSWASAPYTGSVRPGASLGGLWADPARSLGIALALGVAISGHAERPHGFGEIALVRHDVDLRAGPAYLRGPLMLFGFGALGLAIRHAAYSGPGGNEARLVSGTFGLGGQLQVGVLSWVSLTAEISGGLLTDRAEFSLHGRRALRESVFAGRAALGLAFVLPVR